MQSYFFNEALTNGVLEVPQRKLFVVRNTVLSLLASFIACFVWNRNVTLLFWSDFSFCGAAAQIGSRSPVC
jgi:hypothetical protein